MALLLATDFAFILLFGLLGVGVISDHGFALTYDRSYAEVFQYVKIYWLVLLLVGIGWFHRSLPCIALACLFSFMLMDDYATLHEDWGESLATHLNLQSRWMLQGYDFGELIVLGAYAVVSCLILFLAYLLANTRQRRLVRDLFGLLVALAVFVIGVDILHALALPELISNSIGAAEDGGEMLVVSLMVWRLLREATDPDPAAEHPLPATAATPHTSNTAAKL